MHPSFYTLLPLVLSFPVMFSCHKSANPESHGKVVEGEENYADFSSTVGLALTLGNAKNQIGMATCTGTIVRDDLVLTAAHCFKAPPSNGFKVISVQVFDRYSGGDLMKKNISSQTFITFPSSDFDKTNPLSLLNSDAAFVVYPKGTFGLRPARLVKETPKVGTEIHIVGYGNTDVADGESNPEQKRFLASNRILAIDTHLASAIVVKTTAAAKQTSVTGVGDSGGAVYNAQGEVIGIVTGGGFLGESPIENNSSISPRYPYVDYYTNVNDPGIRRFIEAVMKDPAPTALTGQTVSATLILQADMDAFESRLRESIVIP